MRVNKVFCTTVVRHIESWSFTNFNCCVQSFKGIWSYSCHIEQLNSASIHWCFVDSPGTHTHVQTLYLHAHNIYTMHTFTKSHTLTLCTIQVNVTSELLMQQISTKIVIAKKPVASEADGVLIFDEVRVVSRLMWNFHSQRGSFI